MRGCSVSRYGITGTDESSLNGGVRLVREPFVHSNLKWSINVALHTTVSSKIITRIFALFSSILQLWLPRNAEATQMTHPLAKFINSLPGSLYPERVVWKGVPLLVLVIASPALCQFGL